MAAIGTSPTIASQLTAANFHLPDPQMSLADLQANILLLQSALDEAKRNPDSDPKEIREYEGILRNCQDQLTRLTGTPAAPTPPASVQTGFTFRRSGSGSHAYPLSPGNNNTGAGNTFRLASYGSQSPFGSAPKTENVDASISFQTTREGTPGALSVTFKDSSDNSTVYARFNSKAELKAFLDANPERENAGDWNKPMVSADGKTLSIPYSMRPGLETILASYDTRTTSMADRFRTNPLTVRPSTAPPPDAGGGQIVTNVSGAPPANKLAGTSREGLLTDAEKAEVATLLSGKKLLGPNSPLDAATLTQLKAFLTDAVKGDDALTKQVAEAKTMRDLGPAIKAAEKKYNLGVDERGAYIGTQVNLAILSFEATDPTKKAHLLDLAQRAPYGALGLVVPPPPQGQMVSHVGGGGGTPRVVPAPPAPPAPPAVTTAADVKGTAGYKTLAPGSKSLEFVDSKLNQTPPDAATLATLKTVLDKADFPKTDAEQLAALTAALTAPAAPPAAGDWVSHVTPEMRADMKINAFLIADPAKPGFGMLTNEDKVLVLDRIKADPGLLETFKPLLADEKFHKMNPEARTAALKLVGTDDYKKLGDYGPSLITRMGTSSSSQIQELTKLASNPVFQALNSANRDILAAGVYPGLSDSIKDKKLAPDTIWGGRTLVASTAFQQLSPQSKAAAFARTIGTTDRNVADAINAVISKPGFNAMDQQTQALAIHGAGQFPMFYENIYQGSNPLKMDEQRALLNSDSFKGLDAGAKALIAIYLAKCTTPKQVQAVSEVVDQAKAGTIRLGKDFDNMTRALMDATGTQHIAARPTGKIDNL